MKNFELNAQVRTERGTSASRRLRHAGHLPAIVYGAGKESVSLTLSHNEFSKALQHESFYTKILTLNIGEQTERVVLKDLQRHPFRPTILHADLQRVSETHKLHMRIPIHFINEDKCLGVKQQGGIISHHISELEIHCLPKDLPEFIEIDLENVNLNQIVHLIHLELPEGVELATKASMLKTPVVSVHIPKGTQAEDEEGEESSEEQGTEPTEQS
ncbi:MAG: 50S ribosomal protein L25/general stress protein Ctc [Thiomargarita sp.]|nr:50S ribosomal protein L25/general stress protein Ctc [Thiomargarita sp.]